MGEFIDDDDESLKMKIKVPFNTCKSDGLTPDWPRPLRCAVIGYVFDVSRKKRTFISSDLKWIMVSPCLVDEQRANPSPDNIMLYLSVLFYDFTKNWKSLICKMTTTRVGKLHVASLRLHLLFLGSYKVSAFVEHQINIARRNEKKSQQKFDSRLKTQACNKGSTIVHFFVFCLRSSKLLFLSYGWCV